MMGLGKTKLHAKFEDDNFIQYENIGFLEEIRLSGISNAAIGLFPIQNTTSGEHCH